MSSQIFQAFIAPNGGLSIAPPGGGGAGQVVVHFARNPLGELSAILNFAGSNQALITFDATGRSPVSYSLYSVAPTPFIEQSVCNIMQQISSYIPAV